MANIRIKDLPADSSPKADDKVPIDLGSTRNTTVEAFVFAGRPTATKTDAEAGTDNKKAMTPLAVKQAIDAQTGMRYVPVTRRVNSGPGLSGGQELTGDVTLSLNAASIASLAKADSAVQSVNGKSGNTVTIAKGDVGLGNVDNTSDLAKPISTETQTALNAKANSSVSISSGPGLTGGGDLTANRSIALNTASIASLGKADTALQAPGGTTGQILAKNSNTTNDVGWVSSEAATAVSYGPQTLTELQKTQARTNIGAFATPSGTTAEYVRGDGTLATMDSSAVGLGNVANKTEAQMVASGAIADALDGKFDKSGGTVTGDIDATGFVQAQGDIVTQSSLWIGARNVGTELDAKAGFYAGSNRDELNFPVGASIGCFCSPNPDRNAVVSPRLSSNIFMYETGGTGSLLSGVWRNSGYMGTNVGGNAYFKLTRVS